MATRVRKEEVRAAAEAAFGAKAAQPADWGVVLPQQPPIDDEVFEEPETASDRVAVMLGELEGDSRAYVQVSKITDGERVYCCKYSPMQYAEGGLDMIRDAWGSGRYEIRLYGTVPGTNRFTVRTRSEFTLAESRAPKPTVSGQAEPSGIERVLSALMEGQNRMLEALTQRPAAPDPATSMRETLSLMTLMREAMGLTNQPQQKSTIGELVDALKELRGASELITPQEKPSDPMEKMLELGTQVVGMVQQAQSTPAPAPASGVGTPVVMVQPPEAIQQAAPPSAQTHNSAPEMTQEEMEKAVIFELQKLLAELMGKAAAKADVEETAEWVFEQLPQQLDDMFKSAEWFTMLKQVAPAAAAHEEWLTKVRAQVLVIFEEEAASAANEQQAAQGG